MLFFKTNVIGGLQSKCRCDAYQNTFAHALIQIQWYTLWKYEHVLSPSRWQAYGY